MINFDHFMTKMTKIDHFNDHFDHKMIKIDYFMIKMTIK